MLVLSLAACANDVPTTDHTHTHGTPAASAPGTTAAPKPTTPPTTTPPVTVSPTPSINTDWSEHAPAIPLPEPPGSYKLEKQEDGKFTLASDGVSEDDFVQYIYALVEVGFIHGIYRTLDTFCADNEAYSLEMHLADGKLTMTIIPLEK